MSTNFQSLILVVDKSQLIYAYEIYNKLLNMGKNPLIVANYGIEVDREKYSVKSIKDYQEIFKINYSEIRKDVYDLFYSLGEQKTLTNTTLRKLADYKGVSLWDLSAQYAFSELLPILYDFNMAGHILDFEKPLEAYVINEEANLEKIIGLICSKKKISFCIYKKRHRNALKASRFFLKSVIFAKKVKRFLISLRCRFTNLIKFKRLNKKYKILFFTSVERYLDSILPIIFKYNNEEQLVIDNFFASSKKKLKENKIIYADFNGYSLYGLFNRDARKILKDMKSAFDKKDFSLSCLYKGVSLQPLLNNLFEQLIREIYPNSIQVVNILKRIFSIHKPEVVVVINSSVAVTLTAKSLSIPVVAVQRGFVAEFYYFGPVMADAITVDGNYWKEYLVKNQCCDSEKVWITGAPRFDILRDKKFPTSKFNRDKSKKIVVFASTYSSIAMGKIEYQIIEQIQNVCTTMKRIDSAYLIIKPHPYERNLNLYIDMAGKAGLSGYSIVKDVEILELISDADLLITQASTVGYDAVLLDKDVICLRGDSNFQPEDAWDFKKYGAALTVDNLENLEGYIRSALFDSETIARLKKGREEYMQEHAYKLDGNASCRVKEVIDQFLGRHKNAALDYSD